MTRKIQELPTMVSMYYSRESKKSSMLCLWIVSKHYDLSTVSQPWVSPIEPPNASDSYDSTITETRRSE